MTFALRSDLSVRASGIYGAPPDGLTWVGISRECVACAKWMEFRRLIRGGRRAARERMQRAMDYRAFRHELKCFPLVSKMTDEEVRMLRLKNFAHGAR